VALGQVLVRKLEDDVIRRLKAKAKASGRSLEDLARSALREAAKRLPRKFGPRSTEFARMGRRISTARPRFARCGTVAGVVMERAEPGRLTWWISSSGTSKTTWLAA
jgi:plasmid stability protein